MMNKDIASKLKTLMETEESTLLSLRIESGYYTDKDVEQIAKEILTERGESIPVFDANYDENKKSSSTRTFKYLTATFIFCIFAGFRAGIKDDGGIILAFIQILFITFVILIFLFKNKSNFEQFYNTTRFEKYGNGDKIVDQVYCICMPDRREYMKRQINKLGISCVLFNAITPSDLTNSDYKNLTDKSFITKKTRLPLQI